ncbi:MAG: EAL domain-containing protein [Pleurocapsa sp. MO_192.B19]|nr:EAL domain-containing protein [Pleurocapsa sp. MO_192.B19]
MFNISYESEHENKIPIQPHSKIRGQGNSDSPNIFFCKSKGSILVVDDTPNNLQLLFKYLKDAGYKVLVAQDGTKALKIAKAVNPNLILLDIMMSGIDGFETCRQLKTNPDTQSIPIIFMTALTETKTKVKGFDLGAVDYITKPINRDELLARIHTHLTVQILYQRLVKVAQQKQLLFEISDCIRQSLELNLIFQTATEEILKVLKCDRLVLTSLSNENIFIEAQSVSNDEVEQLPKKIELDYCCSSQEEYQDYRQGKVRLIENTNKNINNVDSDIQVIQAKLIVPILLKENTAKANKFYPLWGWLIADQYCPRQWQSEEIELCRNITAQLAIAIEQGLLYQQVKQSNEQLQKSNKQLKLTNQRLQQLALLDPLTQIFNRRYFDRQLNLEWRRLKRNEPSSLSLIMCDVDCFKIYNDTYGHQQGDKCLKQIANALANVIKRPADILARYGGEEFIIALPHTPQTGAIKLAESMRVAVKNLNIPHANSTVDSVVTISLGVAHAISDSKNHPALLVEAADQALYLAKSRGRDCLAVYPGDISQSKQSQANEIEWINRIQEALAKNLFSLYAQPITSLEPNDDQQRFEILLRLTDEDDRVIPPNVFLDIATRNSLMPDIDTWVVDNLLKTLAESNSKNWQNHHFSINLSGASLNSKSFLDSLSQKLTDYHLPSRLFCFEITETVAISNLAKVSNFINSLKTLGCSFALDDFGKGMSSLSYLKNLPIDYLKIDGSFITELNHDKASKVMVEAINHIAEGIGLKTVAEFVENQAILDTVRDLKVDYAQGYHLGRPEKLANILG